MVAEHVNEIGKTLTSHFWNHLVDNLFYIFGLCHSACHSMRSEECRHNPSIRSLLHAPNHAQHLQFVFQIEPVAALYLYTAGSLLYNLVQSAHGLTIELIF